MLEPFARREPSGAVVKIFFDEPDVFSGAEPVPLAGCLRFRDAVDPPLPAFGLAEKVDVPGIASLEVVEPLVPFTGAWPRRVLPAGVFSCSANGEPLAVI